jgi:hypothetical protein
MSTDKLQALHNTVVEILSEPPSPPTFFDEEPYDTAQASEQVAKASDNLQRAPEIPKENFGKPTSRELGISPKKIQEVRPAVSGTGISLGRWVLRGFAGILLAAGIGVAAIIWLGSPGDATKTSPPQPAPLAPTAPTAAALPPELTLLLQSMARDLASVQQEIEQLKASQVELARESAKTAEQLKANQEQMARVIANASEQSQRPRTSAATSAALSANPPRPVATPARKPVSTVPPTQARAAQARAPVQARQQ